MNTLKEDIKEIKDKLLRIEIETQSLKQSLEHLYNLLDQLKGKEGNDDNETT